MVAVDESGLRSDRLALSTLNRLERFSWMLATVACLSKYQQSRELLGQSKRAPTQFGIDPWSAAGDSRQGESKAGWVSPRPAGSSCLASMPIGYPAFLQIVGRQFHGYAVTRQNPDVVLPHFS